MQVENFCLFCFVIISMISLSSSSLVASTNHLCNCGLRAEIRTCWNDDMMAQRFYCCGSRTVSQVLEFTSYVYIVCA